MTNSIYRLASAIVRFFRADPPETPPSPPQGNVADLTRRLTPLDAGYVWCFREDHTNSDRFAHFAPDERPLIPEGYAAPLDMVLTRSVFGKRREPPPLPANDPPSRPFKTTHDGVTCWTECGPGHCAYPGNCVASFRGSFIDTEGTRTPLGAVPVLDDRPLLRPATARAPDGCRCKDRCAAPRPHPCRDPVKRDALARQERARATGRRPM